MDKAIALELPFRLSSPFSSVQPLLRNKSRIVPLVVDTKGSSGSVHITFVMSKIV